MLDIISLRPHHLVCLQSFQGKGYDSGFVEHTCFVLDFLKTHSSEKKIRIVNGIDELCKYCPNNKNNRCSDDVEVQKYDISYSKILDLSLNQTLSWSEVKYRIAEKLTFKDFSKTCEKCCWYDICRSSWSECSK